MLVAPWRSSRAVVAQERPAAGELDDDRRGTRTIQPDGRGLGADQGDHEGERGRAATR